MSNNALYMKNIENNIQHYEVEQLTEKDRYNEYVMTGLRTIWGIEKENLKQFDSTLNTYLQTNIQEHLKRGDIRETEDAYVLSEQAKLRADYIASDLFFI